MMVSDIDFPPPRPARKVDVVTLTVIANGAVGVGKSKAVEKVLAAFQDSASVRLRDVVKRFESVGTEVAVLTLEVSEPWTSER